MALKLDSKDLEKVILFGDRILVKPTTPKDRTKSGLYLPPSVSEKEKIKQGYVVKVGPGYPIPALQDSDESWKNTEEVRYVPLQANVGDLAVFLQSGVHEIFFNDELYFIIPNAAIQMVIRDEGLLI